MNMDDRMTIANMAIEAGGKNGIFPADEKTFAYVNERVKGNGTKADFTPVELDADQSFVYDKVFDLSKLEPTVAMPSRSGPAQAGEGAGNIWLDRAYIGSCTGGKTSDFLAFAEVVQGQQREDRYLRRARDHRRGARNCRRSQWDGTDRLEHPGNRRRADDGKRLVRGLPRRAGGYVWPDEQADELHLRHEPEFPRPHGPQGIARSIWRALHRGRQRVDRANHRSARVPLS